MSTIRDPAYITDAGRTMMTAGGDVTYTKAVLYGQDISHLTSDQVKALTTIGSPLREVKVGISDKQNTDRGTTVILEATFQNDNLANDLPYTAVGFFAQKGNDEKLIAVAVANTGAYLTATSPDGVATDALDLKLAIAIGDATNVTATVDPAGSVTPATLNGAINKLDHDLTAQIDTKADSTDLDKTNTEVAKKADSEDVKSQVDAVNNSITDLSNTVQSNKDATDKALATKADQTAVNDQISKQVTMINTVLDTKVTADYSYSKAELDKKLLALSTDTSGKVDANQVATMIEGKADKADLDNEIKAVTDLANTKANTVDVDSKIKTVTDLANTKANSADVYTKTETDNQINKFDLSKVKFRKQFLNGDGDKVDKTWSATKNDDGTYTIDLYHDDWTAYKLSDVIYQLPSKADSEDVKSQVDAVNNSITDLSNTVQSNKDATDKALATKADQTAVNDQISKQVTMINTVLDTKVTADYSYSKAELDKKLLALSTDTSGKVDANQVATMIEGKADKADLDNEIKAVTDLANTKANTVDVDSKIKTVTDLANTKANSADVYTKTETDNQINKFDLSKVKFRKQFLNGDGDKVDKTWSATKNDDGTYTIDLYHDDWTAYKLSDVIYQLPSKADKSNTYTKTDVDNKVNEAKSNAQSTANQIWGEVNNLNGTNTRNDAVDVNTLEGIANKVTVYRLTNGNNKNTPSWIGDHRGVMIVLNYDGNAKTQIWTPVGADAKDSTGTFGWRYWEGENPPAWNQFSSLSYVDARYQNALPKSGGNMNQRSTINWIGGGINDRTGNLGGLQWSGGTDSAAIFADQDANDNLDLVFKLGDDDSNHFSFRNAAGQEKAAILANGQINSPTIQDLYNKLAQYTVDYNNNYVHDTTIDFNSYLHETRTIKVANVKANNGPLANTAIIWGWLTTYHWDDNSVTQEYRDAGGEVFWRATNASASRQWTWHKYAKQEDIDNQQRQINDLINNINYIKANYVEGRRFPAIQEAQANSWENANPQRIAFIER